MKQGEKMVWAAVFAQVYAEHVEGFRVDMHTAKAINLQREDWRRQGAALAAEKAGLAVEAMRTVDTVDLGVDAMRMVSVMLR